MTSQAKLAVDIGGTFTDLALDINGRRFTAKVLTTPTAPEKAVLDGIDVILGNARLAPKDIGLLIHGTTLATNAIIERKGARMALLVTAGFRDSLEMAYENRFEQYDILMDKPPPLVPRHLRLPVPERINAQGKVVAPLDEKAVRDLIPFLKKEKVESVAIGYLHSYASPVHEIRTRDILLEAMPDLSITLSSEVCPEIREYERWSTACGNAYVQPVMASYLKRLKDQLQERGFTCPVFLITSAGGLTTLETARRFPIRLVESGPAGGAILAARIAQECSFDKIVSFDMGGTTAKICLIDDGMPHYSRSFEVARQYRFLKGSGLPVRIPVIEMVEIGAGGGSIASVDDLGRIQVGPESAGSEPGPACYRRGGQQAAVTDADVVLGRIDPDRFAGGHIKLDAEASRAAVLRSPGKVLGIDTSTAALGIVEVVEENMANAARVHAVERGKELTDRTMIAFGGAAPLHAARLAEKLGIARLVVPTGAGVGSAVGFLMAPVAYEVVRSQHVLFNESFDPAALNRIRLQMRQEAEGIVRDGAPTAKLVELWTAEMRYRGQGHEVTVTVPSGDLTKADAKNMADLFVQQYEQQFGRSIPGLEVEALNWSLRLATEEMPPRACPPLAARKPAEASAFTNVMDPVSGEMIRVPVYLRSTLQPGSSMAGPAVISEDETTTIVTEAYDAHINAINYIVLEKKGAIS
jgi:N-methylhydantoinase A